jgi:hypothetical protein
MFSPDEEGQDIRDRHLLPLAVDVDALGSLISSPGQWLVRGFRIEEVLK